MQRRDFIKNAAAGVAAGAIAAPAIAQSNPTINWRLASSFPKSLDTIFGAAEILTKRVSQLTQGKFNIRAFPGGEIVPALQVLDAVQAGTVEIGHSASYYYFGKDATFAFDTAIPFGLTARQQTAWMDQGGGRQLMREFFHDYGIVNFMGGNTGCQMGGWFRKEIKSVEDLSGLKMRVGGFAGRILQKLGVVPQQIAPGDIYPALEKGTIDSAEWIGPYDDLKLGFSKVAPFYYYPGFWEGGPQLDFFINDKAFNALSPEYKAIVEAAAAQAHSDMQAKYDARNPTALKQLVGSGTKLREFPKDVMALAFKEAMAFYKEVSDKNPNFKKVYDDYSKFRADSNLWFQFTEAKFDQFMQKQKL